VSTTLRQVLAKFNEFFKRVSLSKGDRCWPLIAPASSHRQRFCSGNRLAQPQELPGKKGAGSDPEQEAMLADSVGLALLVVLDRLAPAETVAFVLHDLFGLSFEEIATIVERSPTATRQLASRARRSVLFPRI
jgi:DNA-directed RNA polymerase specialized sigma24 family protein